MSEATTTGVLTPTSSEAEDCLADVAAVIKEVKMSSAAPASAAAPDADASAPVSAPASADSGTSSQIATALNDWVNGLNGPQDPPFSLGAAFPDSEWSHFFRVFTVSTALAGAVAAVQGLSKGLLQPVNPDGPSLGVLTVFTCFGVFYSMYSRIFGIKITIRQSLFCFALVTTPWLPVYVLIKANGGNLGILWFFALPSLGIYVFYLVARAIHIVSGAGTFRVILSLLLAVVLAVIAVAPQILSQIFASGTAPQAPAVSSPAPQPATSTAPTLPAPASTGPAPTVTPSASTPAAAPSAQKPGTQKPASAPAAAAPAAAH